MYRPKFSCLVRVWLDSGSTLKRCHHFLVLRGLAAARYLKLGFGGAHTEANQRLMYTSA
jgi:hypothetical protein